MFLSPLNMYLLSVAQDTRVLQEALVLVCTCINTKADPVFYVVLKKVKRLAEWQKFVVEVSPSLNILSLR